MLRKTILASVLCGCGCLAVYADNDGGKDVKLLHERVDDFLADSGFGSHFSFKGDGNLAGTFVNQKVDEGSESEAFTYEGNVDLFFKNRTDSFGYGVEFSVKTRSGLLKNGRAIVDELYAFIETDRWGTFKVGFTGTAADKFTIGGNSIFTAYGGPDSGNLGAFYNQSCGTIIDTGCPIDDGKAAKIAWFSPTVKGFSLAASFTLDSKRGAPFKTRHSTHECITANDICWDYSHSTGYSRSILTVAGKYEYGDENGFNATLSAGGWFGKGKAGSKTGNVHDVRAYQLGAILGYKDFKFAVGYIDVGRSIVDKYRATGESYVFDPNGVYDVRDPRVGLKHGAEAGRIYTYGMSYKWDALTLSVGYFRSVVKYSDKKAERAIANIVTLGAEYRFNKALSVYAEYNNISTKTCDRAQTYSKACDLNSTGKNHANMIIVGTKIKF